MQEKTISIILAGGIGSRLHPLTAERAKPAVPFGGRYRIIDFTLSNCLHSGLRRILVLTQYKSHSLQKHLRDGWSIYNSELGEYITPVPPQMRTGESWYSGTADAIYQNLYLLERSGAGRADSLRRSHLPDGLRRHAAQPPRLGSRADRRLPDGRSGAGELLRRDDGGRRRTGSFPSREAGTPAAHSGRSRTTRLRPWASTCSR